MAEVFRTLKTYSEKINEQMFLVADFRDFFKKNSKKRFENEDIDGILEHYSNLGKIHLSNDGKTISLWFYS